MRKKAILIISLALASCGREKEPQDPVKLTNFYKSCLKRTPTSGYIMQRLNTEGCYNTSRFLMEATELDLEKQATLGIKYTMNSVYELQDLKGLEVLKISFHSIGEVELDLPRLRKLYIQDSGVRVLNLNTPSLEYIEMGANYFKSVAINAPTLKKLVSPNSELTDISFLEDLDLVELRLAFNRIEDISPIGKMVNLEYLDMEGNNVRELRTLRNLSKLRTLDLSENNITSVFGIEDLGCDFVYLDGNPLEDCPINTKNRGLNNQCDKWEN